VENFGTQVNFILSVADLLRGDYKRSATAGEHYRAVHRPALGPERAS
jgi:hypothetical protein